MLLLLLAAEPLSNLQQQHRPLVSIIRTVLTHECQLSTCEIDRKQAGFGQCTLQQSKRKEIIVNLMRSQVLYRAAQVFASKAGIALACSVPKPS